MTKKNILKAVRNAGKAAKARGATRTNNPWHLLTHCEIISSAWLQGYDGR